MNFHAVAECFEEIEKTPSRTETTKLLADLLKQATPSEAAIIAYLSLGSLNPVYKSTQFNIAEKTLIKVVAKLTSTSLEHAEKALKIKGDLGLVLFDAREKHATPHDGLTVHNVASALKKLYEISGEGSQSDKEHALVELLKDLDALSGKYIVRIILGKLRLGFSDMTLLDAFSWMSTGDKSLRLILEEAYNVSADIGHIIALLKEEGVAALKAMKIEPGIPVRLASAERMISAHEIIKKLGPCAAEPKLDGFRVQVHVDKRGKTPKIHFFSRNLNDMHGMFPDLEQAVSHLPVETFIGEGEAIAYNTETGVFLPFQETVKRKRKHDVESFIEDVPLHLYFFDVLYVDGAPCINETFTQRRAKLKALLSNVPKTATQSIFLIEDKKMSGGEELDEYFNECISSGLEGLVLKKLDAPYTAGKRNFNWVKFKRKESGQLDDTIDCIILGYYAGHGKRASFGIGAFLVGIRNEKNDTIETIAKVGTGLSDTEWKELKKECDKRALSTKPRAVECAKDLVPDVWVSPEIVCAIRADEITLSPMHSAGKTEKDLGYALRFPRLMGYRPDKAADQATDVSEIKRLFKLQFEGKSKKTQRSKE
jgi:DNA ligase-1